MNSSLIVCSAMLTADAYLCFLFRRQQSFCLSSD
uniref:Uncharacterized protein n=1 Tax=Rhizophora mucronata TaxID=61149 RepID=A0A2P2NWU5_RHIMU